MWQDAVNNLKEYITNTAESFGGIADTLLSIDVTSIDGVSDTFTIVGASLTTLFLVMELFTYCIQVDFHGGIETGIRIAMKLVVCELIIENTGSIVGIISGMFKNVADASMTESFTMISGKFSEAALVSYEIEEGVFSINLILVTVILFIIWIALFAIFSYVILSLFGLVFETGVLVAVSPVALSTLVNATARSTAISFIKDFAAVSMQWSVIGVCCKVFSSALPIIIEGLQYFIISGGNSLIAQIMQYSAPLLSAIVFAVTIAKSSEITKRALGA